MSQPADESEEEWAGAEVTHSTEEWDRLTRHYAETERAKAAARIATKRAIRDRHASERAYGVTLRQLWRERMIADKRTTSAGGGTGDPPPAQDQIPY